MTWINLSFVLRCCPYPWLHTQFGEKLMYTKSISIHFTKWWPNEFCSESGPFKIMLCRVMVKFHSLMNENKEKIAQAWNSQGNKALVRVIISHATYIGKKQLNCVQGHDLACWVTHTLYFSIFFFPFKRLRCLLHNQK